MVSLCRAPIALTSSITAAMSNRMLMITCRARTGLENKPMDLAAVGIVPYRL